MKHWADVLVLPGLLLGEQASVWLGIINSDRAFHNSCAIVMTMAALQINHWVFK